MSLFQAVLLAIIEGLTEFLPISSTGHMIIGSYFMGIGSDPFVKTFTVAIQLGAIVSVVVLYHKRFLQSLKFYFVLFVAFLPAAVIGFLFNDYIDALLERVDVVGWMLIAGGVFLLFTDRIFKSTSATTESEVSFGQALRIGFLQCIAMIPGVSRSAATIVGGMSQGLSRKTAAEFSFFLAVPTMLAATGYKLLKFYLEGNSFGRQEFLLLAAGNVVAFVVAMIAIRYFINYLTRHGFALFGYYRIVAGVVLLLLYYLGAQMDVM
jgi:undecaprenyl-diphosphatase